MSFKLIPADSPALATRLRRQLMGLLSYLMFLVPLLYSLAHGWLRFGASGVALLLGLALLANVVFFVAIRSGRTQELADPSLLLPQICIAGLFALVTGYYVEPAAMALVLMLFFTSFFFGVFSLGTRQYLLLTVAATCGYGVMLAVKYRGHAAGSADLRLELLHLMILVVVLLWMSFLGSYISGLRARLAHKKTALAGALARLQELASRDELTGLHNRRHLMETLEQQQERSQRYREPFSLCILDLDHFKRINDMHGHGVGDEVLRAFSDRIRQQMRRMDVIGRGEVDNTFGRYGGEEFLLLLPYAQQANALACMLRLRKAIDSLPFDTSAGSLPITFSAGIAEFHPGETIAQVINRADEALYRAKSAGRDRVECAS